MEALHLLRRSRVISENGIGGTWGEPDEIVAADAAIRAWRPIQVCHSGLACAIALYTPPENRYNKMQIISAAKTMQACLGSPCRGKCGC